MSVRRRYRIAADLGWPLFVRQFGQLLQGNVPSPWVGDFDVANLFEIRPPLGSETHPQRKPPLAFKDLGHFNASDGLYDVEHLSGIDAVASNFIPLDSRFQVGQAGDLFGPHVGCPRNAFEDGCDFLGLGRKRIQIVAIGD